MLIRSASLQGRYFVYALLHDIKKKKCRTTTIKSDPALLQHLSVYIWALLVAAGHSPLYQYLQLRDSDQNIIFL